MRDQADELRELARRYAAAATRSADRPRQIVVSGGKGGVGTTTTAVNLAAALARLGCRTLLVDADLNRADASLLCGIDEPDGIAEVLGARRTVHEVLRRGPAGVQVLPGAWAAGGLVDCSPAAQDRLLQQLETLGGHVDIVVLDVGSGLNHVVRRFWHSADRVLLVTTPQSVAIMDAYAAIKVLVAGQSSVPVQTLVNMAESAEQAQEVHQRIAHACRRFLGLAASAAGHVPADRCVAEAASLGVPVVIHAPESAAAQHLEEVAGEIRNQNAECRSEGRRNEAGRMRNEKDAEGPGSEWRAELAHSP